MAGTEFHRHPWELTRVVLLKSWMAQSDLRPGAILDVGCGDGYVLSEVSAAWPERQCFGIDNGLVAPDSHTPQVTLLPHLDMVPSNTPVAAVLLMDVLEHIEDPVQLLSDLKRRGFITRETVVFIIVPADPNLFSSHDTYLGHFRRYTLASLQALTTEAGLKSNDTGTLFVTLFLVRWLQHRLEQLKLRSSKFEGLNSWTLPAGPTQAIARLLLLDVEVSRWVSRRLGLPAPGLSCFSVCQLA